MELSRWCPCYLQVVQVVQVGPIYTIAQVCIDVSQFAEHRQEVLKLVFSKYLNWEKFVEQRRYLDVRTPLHAYLVLLFLMYVRQRPHLDQCAYYSSYEQLVARSSFRSDAFQHFDHRQLMSFNDIRLLQRAPVCRPHARNIIGLPVKSTRDGQNDWFMSQTGVK